VTGQDPDARMVSAMSRLPIRRGSTFRGVTTDARGAGDIAARYRPGLTLVERAFVSLSASESATLPGWIVLYVFSETGRNISLVSEVPAEDEIVYPPGQAFTVLDRRQNAVTGRWEVYFEEAPGPAAGPDDFQPTEVQTAKLRTLWHFAAQREQTGAGGTKLRPDRFAAFPLGLDDSLRPVVR
jgi:hypothetical protein